MVGEDEDVVVERWVLASGLPSGEGRSLLHDRGADAVGAAGLHAVVGRRPIRIRGEDPLVQLLAADAERVVDALVRPGAISVERDAEVVHAQFGHAGGPPPARQLIDGWGTGGTLAGCVRGPVHWPTWGS